VKPPAPEPGGLPAGLGDEARVLAVLSRPGWFAVPDAIIALAAGADALTVFRVRRQVLLGEVELMDPPPGPGE
jgi:hypothetical protein